MTCKRMLTDDVDRPGRVVITDPERRAILNPGPSPECMAEIERLERMTIPRGRPILLD